MAVVVAIVVVMIAVVVIVMIAVVVIVMIAVVVIVMIAVVVTVLVPMLLVLLSLPTLATLHAVEVAAEAWRIWVQDVRHGTCNEATRPVKLRQENGDLSDDHPVTHAVGHEPQRFVADNDQREGHVASQQPDLCP